MVGPIDRRSHACVNGGGGRRIRSDQRWILGGVLFASQPDIARRKGVVGRDLSMVPEREQISLEAFEGIRPSDSSKFIYVGRRAGGTDDAVLFEGLDTGGRAEALSHRVRTDRRRRRADMSRTGQTLASLSPSPQTEDGRSQYSRGDRCRLMPVLSRSLSITSMPGSIRSPDAC